ncbi:hypothetical protein CLOM_g9255 [Closterium sp. NIES-68]|nr:hypothetical protein CLOM_g9255 [Closterium sp. NIES-68]
MPRAQRECGHKVKVIRSDNGGEFIGADFEGELKRKGIQHQLTVPYNPQQNGVAERFNRTVQEGARTLLGRAGLPDPFWVSALRQVALVKNRVLATVGEKEWIPYTKWYGSAPADHKGWLLWDLTTQKLTVSRDVKFLESLYYKEWKQQQQKLPSTPLIVEADELTKNACLHGLTKHIRPKWHWVRRLLDKEVRLEIVKTHQQAADIFTKRLAEADHWKGMKLAGMSVH